MNTRPTHSLIGQALTYAKVFAVGTFFTVAMLSVGGVIWSFA